MAAMVVALDYDLLPGIEPGTWAQHAEVLASGATVQSRGACWRGSSLLLDPTRLDPRFHHRKFHRLLALAGFAAVAFTGVSCHTAFGVASRRDQLAYVRFEEPCVVYGPPVLAGLMELLCSGLAFELHVDISAPAHQLAGYALPAQRHVNAAVQARYAAAKAAPGGPGALYNGVYVTGLFFAPGAAAGTACARISCRRPDDHDAVFVHLRQFLAAQLRGGAPRMRSRPPADPVDMHHGSWLLIHARDAVLQRAGVLHVPVDRLVVKHARHPALFSMYARE